MSTNPTISVEQLLRLKSAFEDISTRLSELSQHSDAQQVVLGLSQSAPSIINIGQRIQDDLVDPLSDVIDSAIEDGLTSLDDFADRLNDASLQAQSALNNAIARLEQMANGREVMWFELDVASSATLLDYALDFGQTPDAETSSNLYDQGLRLTGDVDADIEVGVGGTLRVGVDLNEDTPFHQAVLIDMQGWEVSLSADAVVEDLSASFGVLDMAPTDAALSLDVIVPLTLVVGTDSYMDLGKFNTESIETIFQYEGPQPGEIDDSPDIELTIPFDLQLLGFDEDTASLEVRIVSDDAFSPDSYEIEWPVLRINGEPFDFNKFRDITVDDLGTFLNEFERLMPDWFDELEVPGLGHQVGEIVNFAQKVNDFVEQFRNDDGSWNFNGVQEFIERLEQALTPGDAPVVASAELRWSETADALEWDFEWHESFAESVAADVEQMTDGILPFNVQADGSATVSGDVTVQGTIGVALTSDANMVTLTPESKLTDLNSGFGLTSRGLLENHADISFSLSDGSTLEYDLNDITGLGNTATIADLINLLNSDDGLGGQSRLTASLVENRLVIRDNTTGGATFAVTAPSVTVTTTPDWADPESTDFDFDYTSVSVAPLVLGLWGATALSDADGKPVITSNTLASISPLDRIYFQESDPSTPFVQVEVQSDASINGGAALGPLSLSLVDGELRSQAQWDLDIVDTGIGADDGRLFLSEWFAADSVLDAFEQDFVAPTVDGVFQFKVTPDEYASAYGIDNSLYSRSPIDDHQNTAGFSQEVPYLYLSLDENGELATGASDKLQAVLDGGFRGLSLADLPEILNYLFQSLSQTEFWNLDLPLINKSLGDLLGEVPDLGSYYDSGLPLQNTAVTDAVAAVDWAAAGESALGSRFDELVNQFNDLATDWANERPAANTQGWDTGFLARVDEWLVHWGTAVSDLGATRDEFGVYPTEELNAFADWAREFDEYWAVTPPRIQNYDWDRLQFDMPDFDQWFDQNDPTDPDNWGLPGWRDALEEQISQSRDQIRAAQQEDQSSGSDSGTGSDSGSGTGTGSDAGQDQAQDQDLLQTFERLQEQMQRLASKWDGLEKDVWDEVNSFLEEVSTWRGALQQANERLQALDYPDLDDFKQFVQQMSDGFDQIPMGLQDFGGWIESILPRIPGLTIDVSGPLLDLGDLVSGIPPTLIFDLEMNIGTEASPLSYAYDLSALDLGAIQADSGVDVLSFTSTGDLALMLDGSISTRFGIDLENMQPLFDLADLNADLSMLLQGEDLELGVSLGGLAGVTVGDVDVGDGAHIRISSTGDTSAPATLVYNGVTGLVGDAAFEAYMPIYVNPSLGEIPAGGLVTIDAAAELTLVDGQANFDPSFDIEGNFGDLVLNGARGLSAWIDGAILFIDGLAYTLESELVSSLPFVPDRDFDGPGTFLGEFRDVLETARDLNSLQGLDDAFSGLFAQSSAWSGGLSFLIDGVAPTAAQLGESLDTLLSEVETFVVDFDISALELATLAASSLDLGLDSLGVELTSDAGLDAALSLDFDVGLGYDFAGGGFDVIAAQGVDAPEVEAELAVGFQQDSNAKLALGPLQFALTDGRAGSIVDGSGNIDVDAAELYASFAMDLGSGTLEFQNFSDNLDLRGSVLAALDLDLTSNVGLGVELMTGFYDTGVTPVTFSLNPGDSFGDSLDTSKFKFDIDNTYLSLDSLIGDPVLDMIDKVQAAFEPLMPVVDMISSEVPLISSISKKIGQGEVTYLDAISWFGEGAEQAAQFVEFLSNTVALGDSIANLINTGSDGGVPKLYLGGLSSGSSNPRSLSSSQLQASDPSAADQGGATDAADEGMLSDLNRVFNSVGIKVPVFENPSCANWSTAVWR